MKTRSEILQELRNSLNSPTWMQLKNSLIGKELLSLGAEIIYRNTLVKESFTDGFDPNTCDYSDLITLARRNNCAVSNNEPSYVKSYATALKFPFADSRSLGGVTFKNIDYLKSGDLATYYEGQAVELYSNDRLDMFTGIDDHRSISDSDYYVNMNGITYIKLNNKVLPSSVYFFAVITEEGTNITRQIPIYDHSMFSDNYENGNYIKVVTLEDGCIALQVPNATSYVKWAAYFLELAHTDFDTSDATDIVEAYVGTENNLEYARSTYERSLYQYNVIHTVEDIKRYVNDCEGVLDSKVFVSPNLRKVAVYIKPSVKGSTITETYSNITYQLKMHGDLFSDYSVLSGTPLEFSFVVSSDSKRNEIEALLKETYSYENMGFDTPVVASEARSIIFDALGVKVDVHLNIQEKNTQSLEYSLQLIPENGSITYSKTDTTSHVTDIVAWDKDGVIYQKDSGTSINWAKVIGQFSNTLIYEVDATHYSAIDAITFGSVDITGILTTAAGGTAPNGITWYSSSTNPIFKNNGTTYVLYDTPFWHNPSGVIPSAATAWSTTQSFTATVANSLNQNAVVYNKVLYSFGVANTAPYIVTLYRSSANTVYGQYAIGTLGNNENIVSTVLKGGNIYIFTSLNNVYRVGVSSGFTSMVKLTCNLLSGSSLGILAYLNEIAFTNGTALYIASDIIDGGSVVTAQAELVKSGLSTAAPLCIYKGDTSTKNGTAIEIYRNGSWTTNTESKYYGSATYAGVVSYVDGSVSLSAAINADTISYKSQSSKLEDSDIYFVLKDEPVIWR